MNSSLCLAWFQSDPVVHRPHEFQWENNYPDMRGYCIFCGIKEERIDIERYYSVTSRIEKKLGKPPKIIPNLKKG